MVAVSDTDIEKKIISYNSISENRLEQNQRNPFIKETVISHFLVSNSVAAKIAIRDLQARVVRILELNETGNGKVTVNARALRAGTYTYSLETNGTVYDTKIMVVTGLNNH